MVHFHICYWLILLTAGKIVLSQHHKYKNKHLIIFNFCLHICFYYVLLFCVVVRSTGPVACESLKHKLAVECERIEERIMNTWFPKVIHLLTSKDMLQGVRAEKLDSFYNCVSTLISNQVRR